MTSIMRHFCAINIFSYLIFAILSQYFLYFFIQVQILITTKTSDDVNCFFSILFHFVCVGWVTHTQKVSLSHSTKGINNNHFNGINDFTFRLIKLFDFSKQSSIKFITHEHTHRVKPNFGIDVPVFLLAFVCYTSKNKSHKVNINE